MAIQKRVVGRLPLFFGEYNANTRYSSMNRVTYYGSEFQVKMGANNEYISTKGVAPCGTPVKTEHPDGKVTWEITPNEPWLIVSNLTTAYMATEKMKDIDSSINTLDIRISNLVARDTDITITISPTVIYKDTSTNISVSSKVETSGTLTSHVITRGTKTIASGGASIGPTTDTVNASSNQTYVSTIVVDGVTVSTNKVLSLVNAIYYGTNGTNPTSNAKASARTSIYGTYNVNIATGGSYVYFYVPNDLPGAKWGRATVSGFDMPFDDPTQSGLYIVYKSSRTYDAGTLTIVIS